MAFPSELVSVLSKFPGYSICVKGSPGSGKTAFVLALLKELCKDGNALYVSTRVRPSRLFEMFPWASKTLRTAGILDATSVESCQLDQGDLFELLKYRTMPEFAHALYQKAALLKEPVIAIDSWDAVLEATGGNSKQLHDLVLDLALQKGARLILVIEDGSRTRLEYLADGLVELGLQETASGVSRYLQIVKLRGSPHPLAKLRLEISENGVQVMGPLNNPWIGQ